MGRSSRILFFLGLGALGFGLAASAPADAQRLMVRVPTIVRVPHAFGPAPVRPQPGAQSLGRRVAAVRSAGRFGPVVRRNGAGLYGVGLGLSLAGDLAAPPLMGPADVGGTPEILYAPPLPACVRPQVIKIGLGARHDRPRVIYGPPTGCRF